MEDRPTVVLTIATPGSSPKTFGIQWGAGLPGSALSVVSDDVVRWYLVRPIHLLPILLLSMLMALAIFGWVAGTDGAPLPPWLFFGFAVLELVFVGGMVLAAMHSLVTSSASNDLFVPQ